MRIAIDARYAIDHFPGIGRYVYNLITALAELDHLHTLLVLHNPALHNTRYDIRQLAQHRSIVLLGTAAAPFSLREQVAVPWLLRQVCADLYHAPYYVRPYAGLPCPSIVTLHDAIPHQVSRYSTRRARLLFDLFNRLAIRSSRHLLTVSASARRDLIAAFGILPERISVTPEAAGPDFRPQPQEVIRAIHVKYSLPEQYVLSLASNQPHKNLVRLVEAWARLVGSREQGYVVGTQGNTADPPDLPVSVSPCLVLAGHWDPRYPEARATVERLGLGQSVRLVPDVAEADLPALYAGATCFAFPSLYEGFGLPPLEAMACGVAVLCGNSSSLPEVIGEAALMVDVNDTAAITAGLERLLQNDALRAALATAGLQQAARFSWRRTAEATVAVYEAVGRHV